MQLVSRQTRSISLNGQAVEYTLNRKLGRRGAGLKVDHGGLIVNTGVATPVRTIEEFIQSHAAWVLTKLKAWEDKRVRPPQWSDGERLPWLGGEIELRLNWLVTGRVRTSMADGELHLWLPHNDATRVGNIVTQFYKREACKYFEAHTQRVCRRHGIVPPKVMITSAKGRWGSCNSRREIRINWRLIKAPLEEIDYVICHELGHLSHMNHSDAFWAVVTQMCPDWKRVRKLVNEKDFLYRAF